jgi:hypothetical protein
MGNVVGQGSKTYHLLCWVEMRPPRHLDAPQRKAARFGAPKPSSSQRRSGEREAEAGSGEREAGSGNGERDRVTRTFSPRRKAQIKV